MIALANFFDIARKQPYHHAVVVGQKSELTKELNKKTWALFSEAVERECSPEVIDRVKTRYHLIISPLNENPLLIKNIHAVQTAIADKRAKELGPNVTKDVLLQSLSYRIPLEKPVHRILGGVPNVTVLPDKIFMDRKRLQLSEGIEKLEKDAYYQRLSMAIVSHPLEKGMLIPAPDEKGGLDYYEIVHLGGKEGMELCALAPIAVDSNLKPIIVLQPTQLSLDKQAISTIINDIEPDLGNTGYKASQDIIKKVMKDPRFNQGDAILTAFSLGVSHGQRLFKDYPNCFQEVVFFNGPSPSVKKIARKFREIVNKNSWKKQLDLRIYRNVLMNNGKRYEDLTSGFGKLHLGWKVRNPFVSVKLIELRYKTKNTSIKNRHVKRILDCNPQKRNRVSKVVYKGKKADKLLNNSKRQGTTGWLETVRSWGARYFIHPLLNCFWTICRSALQIILAILFGPDKQSSSSLR